MSPRKTPSVLLLVLLLCGMELPFPGDAAGASPTFQPLAPCLVFDTRLPGDGPPVTAAAPRIVSLWGKCGIPIGIDIVAAALDVATFRATGSGPFTLWLTEPLPIPPFSPWTRMHCPGGVCTDFAAPALDGGDLRIAVVGGGSAHVVLTVSGYFYFP